MAETPLLPKPTPVGLPSSNPLFRALDILTGGIAGAVTGDNIKRRVRDEQLQNAIEAQAREEAIRQQIKANQAEEAKKWKLDPNTATPDQIRIASELGQLDLERRKRLQDGQIDTEIGLRKFGYGATAMQPATVGPINPFASPNVRGAMSVGQPMIQGKLPEQLLAEAEAKRKQQSVFDDVSSRENAQDLADYQRFFGSSADPTHIENGRLTAIGRQALDDKQNERELNKSRGIARTYAKLDVENAGIDPNSPEGKELFKDRFEYHTAPGAAKQSMAIAKMQVDAGVLPKEQYKREAARIATFGGKPPQLSNGQEDVILADSNAIANAADVIDMVNSFESRYGDGSFDQFVGPFDAKVKGIQWKFAGANTPQEKDAMAIREKWSKLLNQRIYDASGKAITMAEFDRIQDASGNMASNGFKNSLGNFIGQTAQSLTNRLDALQSYAIPESLTRIKGKKPMDYYNYGVGERRRAAAPAAAPSASPAASFIDAAKAELARRKGGKQ